MSKQFMPDMNDKDRLMLLQETAAKVEQGTYQKVLDDDDLAGRREDLADNCIKLNKLEDELKEYKDDYKAQMEPLKNHNKTLLQEIKTKQTTKMGTLFHLANYEDGVMETYDQDGDFINSRRLRPDEKQGQIFGMKKVSGE